MVLGGNKEEAVLSRVQLGCGLQLFCISPFRWLWFGLGPKKSRSYLGWKGPLWWSWSPTKWPGSLCSLSLLSWCVLHLHPKGHGSSAYWGFPFRNLSPLLLSA